MIRTAARVEINQREIRSNPSHSALSMRGITFNAFNHMPAFIIFPLSAIFGIISIIRGSFFEMIHYSDIFYPISNGFSYGCKIFNSTIKIGNAAVLPVLVVRKSHLPVYPPLVEPAQVCAASSRLNKHTQSHLIPRLDKYHPTVRYL